MGGQGSSPADRAWAVKAQNSLPRGNVAASPLQSLFKACFILPGCFSVPSSKLSAFSTEPFTPPDAWERERHLSESAEDNILTFFSLASLLHTGFGSSGRRCCYEGCFPTPTMPGQRYVCSLLPSATVASGIWRWGDFLPC